jgi:hypothetical protein
MSIDENGATGSRGDDYTALDPVERMLERTLD